MSDGDPRYVSSGIPALDEVVHGLRLGDNVVWQVERLSDYVGFAGPFIEHGLSEGRRCTYIRFAPHAPVIPPRSAAETVQVDPGEGFDLFSSRVHHIIEERGRETFYVFDSLSSLVEEWATDEQLANFFQVTCPYLYELDTVAYFALLRGQHGFDAIARIRDTTQLLLDVYRARDAVVVHPQKVWDRYSPQMFLPHRVHDGAWTPLSHSGEAAAVSSTGTSHPLRGGMNSIAPWESIYRRLSDHWRTAGDTATLSPEAWALRQELAHIMLGAHAELDRLAEQYLTVPDLFGIRDRVIGSGRVGGKAAGMLLARAILLKEEGEVDFSRALEPHDSFYIGSDVFFTFLVNNDLFRTRLSLSRSGELSWEDFEEVEGRFLAGRFPPEILEQFRAMLDYFGQAPIIVRSSSFQEDSFGNVFAGKYRSEFCPNQGGPEARMEAFLRAVKLVYASALNPDALSYRSRRGLSETDEQMAILVQRVSGMPYRHCFFPPLAGVAFSRNLYAWNERIDPAQGMIRLVFGLGTRAVERVGGDYPRMIAVSHPELRPEVGPRIAKYSQRLADVLDLEGNRLVSVPIAELLHDLDYPSLHYLVSVRAQGGVTDPVSRVINAAPDDLVLTFNKLINQTDFVPILGEMLAKLERAYGSPVDTEFTGFVDRDGQVRVNLLQCRPMAMPGGVDQVSVPEDVPAERTVFRSSRLVGGGLLHDVRFLIYIDPRRYAEASIPTKKSLGRIVGTINKHTKLRNGRTAMVGPGRWGSSNIALGVNVGYADIDNAAILVEIAHEEAGHVPEVSYGTHFFQDLVEAGIIYCAVYPGDADATLNDAFLTRGPNVLGELAPDAAELDQLIKVIDVPAAADGAHIHIVADPERQRAVCYLA
ncbi:MAG: PEP/pyruvate-binding domain-containing protein [Candidatus Brocadiia bacterium]